jgi:hypothetical protein
VRAPPPPLDVTEAALDGTPWPPPMRARAGSRWVWPQVRRLRTASLSVTLRSRSEELQFGAD